MWDFLTTIGHGARPFYFEPPDDRFPVMLMKLQPNIGRRQASDIPRNELREGLALSMIEVLG